MGETIALAKEYGVRVVDVVLTESELRTGLDREGVLKAVMEEYAHNLKAVEIGVSGGNSFLLGTVPTQLKEMGPGTIFADVLLDKALMYTVAAEVGNHCIGVRPCAGTGDPCPYTGFLRALMDVGTDETTRRGRLPHAQGRQPVPRGEGHHRLQSGRLRRGLCRHRRRDRSSEERHARADGKGHGPCHVPDDRRSLHAARARSGALHRPRRRRDPRRHVRRPSLHDRGDDRQRPVRRHVRYGVPRSQGERAPHRAHRRGVHGALLPAHR